MDDENIRIVYMRSKLFKQRKRFRSNFDETISRNIEKRFFNG